MRPGLRCLGVLLWLGLSGCQDDLPKITFVRQLESLGARVEVVGDPERSNPKPGERVIYTPAVVVPERDLDLSGLSTLAIECTEPDFSLGVPICQELIDAVVEDNGEVPVAGLDELLGGQGGGQDGGKGAFPCTETGMTQLGPLRLHCAVGAPAFTLTIPEDSPTDEEGQYPARLLVGIYCNGGTAALGDGTSAPFVCLERDGEEFLDRLVFFGTVGVKGPGDQDNHHPSADPLRLSLEGPDDDGPRPWQPWPQTAPPAADACDDAGGDTLPTATLGEDFTIEIAYSAGQLERVDGEREALEISSYTNAGELERRYTLFGPDTQPGQMGRLVDSLTWSAPGEGALRNYGRREPSDPVRFHFALRDQRGGFTRVDAYLCLRAD